MPRDYSSIEIDYAMLCLDMSLDLQRQLRMCLTYSARPQLPVLADRELDKAIATVQAIQGYLIAMKGFRF